MNGFWRFRKYRFIQKVMWVKAMCGKTHREVITRRLGLLKKILEDFKPTTEILNGCTSEITTDEKNIEKAAAWDRDRLDAFIQRLLNSIDGWPMAS